MSCLFGHKWGEWSDTKEEKYQIFHGKTNVSLGTRSWLYQERVCKKCKRIQRQGVDNYMTKGV